MELFIGNISFDATREDVIDAIREAGLTVDNIRLLPGFEGTNSLHRGFGFAEISGASDRDIIARLNGREVMGRPLRVDRAQQRRPNKSASHVGAYARQRR